MKAFILDAARKLTSADIPAPEPGPDQVRVKVAYCGICGSDVEAYLGRRSAEFLADPPRLGHELSGIIDKIGENVTGLRVGDRVVTVGVWGGFAEYILARPDQAMRLLPEIPLIEASMVEALPGIMKSTLNTEITGAHDVLVLGQGSSGLPITRLVALHGCKKLIAVDLFDEKLDIAMEFGATHRINASRENIAERVDEIVPGGVDLTIMATLDGNDVPKGLDWTRRGGKIVLYGSIGPCEGIDFFRVHAKAISIVKETTGSVGDLEHRRLWREAMHLVADGVLNTKRLRTHIFPLAEVPRAMELRSIPRPDVIHVLVENEWARKRRLAGDEL